MPSPPRLLFPDYLTFVTTRIEEGLPLVPTPYMKCILESIFARAQTLFAVDLNHYLVMTNHLHLILRVWDPEAIAKFMDYIKTESAHAINKLLGRKKRTVWTDSYDAVPMLTLEDAVAKIVYLYTNPAEAHLVAEISEYPGVSSWTMYQTGELTIEAPWIRRPTITELPKNAHQESVQKRYAANLIEQATTSHLFTLSPDSWMSLYGVNSLEEREALNQRIVTLIKEKEEELRQDRTKEGREVLGRARLQAAKINAPFTPKKWARRMWCICHDQELRKKFIALVKSLRDKAREVREKWKLGDMSMDYPFPLFTPRYPKRGSILVGFFEFHQDTAPLL